MCPIPADTPPGEALQLAQRYSQQLTEAHDAACPWRSACCAPSLLRFPPVAKVGICVCACLMALKMLVNLIVFETCNSVHSKNTARCAPHSAGSRPEGF
jgi:hypothetical protein